MNNQVTCQVCQHKFTPIDEPLCPRCTSYVPSAYEVLITRELSIHQLAEIRGAILTVIDDGRPLQGGGANPWALYPAQGGWREDSEHSVAHRMEFVDAIQRLLTARLRRD
jgi:hypothetical protein